MALHGHFQADRIARTEWFVLSSQIRDYVAQRKAADASARQPELSPAEEKHPAVPLPGARLPQKPATATEKIIKVLGDFSDPIGLSAVYVHRDQIGELAKLTGSTLDNALSRLAKTGAIHRQPGSGRAVRGKYGLGPEG